MKALVLALALLTGNAFAQAVEGVAADAATTAVAISSVPGATELNPIGYVSIPARLILLHKADQMPAEQGVPIKQAVAAASWGAAVNNALVIGGAGGPVTMVAGALFGTLLWVSGAEEREFWAMCAQQKHENPAITSCSYNGIIR